MKSYDHKKIEKKWQKNWLEDNAYKTETDPAKPKYYVLDMFPYPSGAGLHVGHPKGYIASDIEARKKRMEGYRVLHPMGWDAFGLPAENYAIKTGTPPRKTTDESIATFKKQIAALSLSYDWDREIGTHMPEYYRWTQWLFAKFFENGLAYKKKALVNWDPVDQTVLANEQVLPDGTAERSGAKVEKKELEQWFYKITDYADQLIEGLDKIDWPESTKINQRNWIGKSEGAEIDLGLDLGKKYKYVILHGFTSAPDRPRFLWMKEELEKLGHTVILPRLPDTDAPNEKDQVAAALEATDYDENTILVGFSLGSVVAMKVLEKLDKPIARLVTVGGFRDRNFKDNPRNFDTKFNWDFDQEKIRRNAPSVTILHDIHDHAISEQQVAGLEELLGVKAVRVEAEESHFGGDKEPEVLMWIRPTIRVFTTRPDTLFGATYLVLAPEHPWIALALQHQTVLKNNDEVAKYVAAAKQKSDIDRLSTDKEKTGVKLEGVEAINPATGEKMSLFVADYVLAHYGTGAIMAVPAHDERDYEFAKKFNLPIKQVIRPEFIDSSNPPKSGKKEVYRKIIEVFVRKKNGDTLLLFWKGDMWGPRKPVTGVVGGVEDGEDTVEAARREVIEETGYVNLVHTTTLPFVARARFYAAHKNENRLADATCVVFELQNEEQKTISPEELAKHEPRFISEREVTKFLNVPDPIYFWQFLLQPKAYVGTGSLINSGEYDDLTIEEAKQKITEQFGRKKVTYKLRDWLISRQRYWGAPIPIVYDPEGKSHVIPDEHLPWLLPEDVEYLPKGTSPLGSSKELFERTEKIFGKGWKPEIDTMDTFVCSSWYFFRFADPHNDREFASQKALQEWLPVDLYVGGAEHTVLHLLYARFFTKAMRDLGYVLFDEPFLKLRHQGLIVAEDGRKMSKRYGNVINPDDIVEKYGADTLRMYEMFMGPFQDSIAWNTQSMIGSRRFLERVWRFQEKCIAIENFEIERLLHKTIKKVGEDIDAFKFNTAISTLMIFMNAAEKDGITKEQFGKFLTLLAPFAPHITEELWHELGNPSSIHMELWPVYDQRLIQDQEVTIAIQVNGKLRATMLAPTGINDAELDNNARKVISEHLSTKEVKGVIIVPNRLINFVTF